MKFAKYSVEDLVHYNYFNNINYSLFSQSTAIVSRIILINMVFCAVNNCNCTSVSVQSYII